MSRCQLGYGGHPSSLCKIALQILQLIVSSKILADVNTLQFMFHHCQQFLPLTVVKVELYLCMASPVSRPLDVCHVEESISVSSKEAQHPTQTEEIGVCPL